MAFKIVKQPKLRAAAAPWEEAAPGLYDDGEVLVQVGDVYAAVSVSQEWYEGGVNLLGTARWCDADGQTHLTDDGRHVETFYPARVDAGVIAQFGLDALKRDVLLILIGEEPECVVEAPVEGGDALKVPIMQPDLTTRHAMNIVHAAQMVSQMKSAKPERELLKGPQTS